MNKDQKAANADRGPAPSDDGGVEIRRLVADHHGLVYRYAFRLTGNQPDAEDVAQQTFLTAQQSLCQLRQRDNPVPWLLAIARSCWMKSRRRRRPVAAAVLEMDMEAVPGRLPEHGEVDHQRLQSALEEIGDEFKLPLLMFYFEEKSYKEIAAELSIPIGTVMSRLARAKSHLRQWLLEHAATDKADHESTTAKSLSQRTHELPIPKSQPSTM